MTVRVVAFAAVLSLGAGCIKNTGPTRERSGASFLDGAPEIKGPTQDRCEKLEDTGRNAGCSDAKYLAQNYVRRLAPTDEVCLENGFGEEPGGDCLARAFVSDTAVGRVLVEIREAKPESRWFNHMQHQIWFQESALVDLYLAERGY